MLVRSLLAAAVGGAVFQRINIPAGALIGAMVGVAAVGLSGTATLGPGPYLRFVAFAIIGWELGSQIDRSTLESVRSAAIPILVVVGGLLAAAGFLALILHGAGLDPITSFLAASPAGSRSWRRWRQSSRPTRWWSRSSIWCGSWLSSS